MVKILMVAKPSSTASRIWPRMLVWKFRAINFRREAFAAAGFQHPNIIKVFEIQRVDWVFQDPLKNQPGHLDLSGSYPLELYVANIFLMG